MGIRKQEFYEGAAIYSLLRASGQLKIAYRAPFFVLSESRSVYLKYSTAKRSPWAFTFAPGEQATLQAESESHQVAIALICGAEGVVCLPYSDYQLVAAQRFTSVRVACRRLHGRHFTVLGPDGELTRKIPSSDWPNLLREGV